MFPCEPKNAIQILSQHSPIQEVISLPQCDANVRDFPLYGLTPFTLLDYPDHTACILWFSGCNMRCGYCHNPQIVNTKGTMKKKQVLDFLRKRRGLLDGVVLSGGEASLYPDLIDLVQDIRSMGYAIKLDTNGSKPKVIKQLLENRLIDCVALDYKAPSYKHETVTYTTHYKSFDETLTLLCKQDIVPFEVRTTVHTGILSENDINIIINDLDEKGFTYTYYIQNFINSSECNTLNAMSKQSRILDRAAISAPLRFSVKFRNF